MRSATREPVAGVVSVSMWSASMRRPEHAALVVELLDRHHRAEALLDAARGVLAARVHGEADDERLLLRGLGPGVVHGPRAEERRGGSRRDGLHQAAAFPRDKLGVVFHCQLLR
jgi:hypothetical protein